MTPQDNLGVADQGGELAPPVSSGEQGQLSGALPDENAGLQQPEVELTEEQLAQLDLTQPEHLQQFRTSYEKRKFERDEAARERDDYKTQLDTFHSTQQRSVYLSTDKPLEDFNPAEDLQRMADEDPEYHEKLVSDILTTHWWDNVPNFFGGLAGRVLDTENNPEHQEIADHLHLAWDTMAQRLSAGRLNGVNAFIYLSGLMKSPELAKAVWEVAHGGQANLPSGGTQYGQPPNQPPMQQGQTEQQIAQEFGLDLSESGHKRFIAVTLAERQAHQRDLYNAQQERATLQTSISNLRDEIKKVQTVQTSIQGDSAQTAEQQAESKLDTLLDSGIDSYIQSEYGTKIPKDRLDLPKTIKVLVKEELKENVDYGTAAAVARKWFKQAATAKSRPEKERAEQKGLDALAVVTVHRKNAVDKIAKNQLGQVRQEVSRRKDKIAGAEARREFPAGGGTPPPAARRDPIESGDLAAAKARIRATIRNRGVLNR